MVLKTDLNCVIHLVYEYQHSIDLWFWNFFCLADPGIFCGRLWVFLWHPYFLTRSPSLPAPNISLSLAVPPILLLKHWSSHFCLLLRYLAHTTYFLTFSSFIPEHSINTHFSLIDQHSLLTNSVKLLYLYKFLEFSGSLIFHSSCVRF